MIFVSQNTMTNEYKNEGSRLEIETLGRFVVKSDQRILTSEARSSKKIWTLFMYLLTYRQKSLLPEVIVDHLWPEANFENPRGLLRTQMHRLRKLMNTDLEEEGSSIICYDNGAYYWNPDVQYQIDADLFESMSAEAREMSASDPQGAVQLYLRSLEYYQGDYLPECSGEDWVIPAKMHYRRLFMNNVIEACQLLTDLKQYSKVLNVCEKAMFLEPSEESFHLIYLETLLKTGKVKEAQHHYQYVTSLQYRELGIAPSASMKMLYQQIVGYQTPELVLPNSSGDKTSSGAFYCHPTVFESICQLEKRKCERHGTCNQVCMFTWKPNDTGQTRAWLEKTEMTIKNDLLHHLRRSDALTRISDRRFAALFPGLTPTQTKQLIDRLMSYFNEEHKELDIQITITIQPQMQESVYEEEEEKLLLD